MTQLTLNTGASANDGTGDTLLVAGTKINLNFTELYTQLALLTNYSLPTATTSVLGGVKVDGTSIVITNGVISSTSVGTGNVIGPATATDNAITRFDATTGKLLQNSLVTISDLGAIVAPIASSIIPFHYDNQAGFPSATTYHGAIAHSHADGKMYFAHSSAWLALANASDVPAAQVQTDWNAVSGLGVVLNKPTIPAAQVQSDWTAVSGLGVVLNKPTIPSSLSTLSGVTITSPSAGQVLKYNGSIWINDADAVSSGAGVGTVTTVSVASANGFTGTVATSTTTPAITITTSITGVLKGNGTAISAATSGTDYQAPVSATGILKSSGVSGNVSAAVAGTDYQVPITFTTTGSSGAATFNGTALNIPQYASGATAFTGLSDASSASLTVDKFYLPATTKLTVTASGSSAYLFDQYTGNNPTIYASSGTTIAFDLGTGALSSHPFLIRFSGTNYNTGLTHVTNAGVVTTGSSAQGKTSGTLYWKIPSDISGDYGYLCSSHGTMIGKIIISATLVARNSTNATTASLANNAASNITITGWKSYMLLSIQTSAAAWVTVYTSSAARSADASRAITTDPTPGSGVLAEIITTGSQTQLFSPAVLGFNDETSPTTDIQVKVVNRSGSTTTITVTMKLVQLEV